MNEMVTIDPHGVITEPATLTIKRLLPGPIERVWAYLTQSELRRQWMAAGEMELKVGATFQLTWRNDELSEPPGRRPEGFPEEMSRESTITELDPPYLLGFTWGVTDGVSIRLEEAGNRVLLTLVHRRLPDRSTTLNVSAGWHAHLDILATRLAGGIPDSFWNAWQDLKDEYAERIPE